MIIYLISQSFLVENIRWTLINKIFEKEQVASLQQLIDSKATSVDDISEVLMTFGEITRTRREDALLSVYSMLLNGKFCYLNYDYF